ncbi:MAG TPA: hypothetical protein VFY88_00500 [Intrasporangium sp.]|nr:hypothetical protein [Intrasporangium sp.]
MEFRELGAVELAYAALEHVDYGSGGQWYGTMDGSLEGPRLAGTLALTKYRHEPAGQCQHTDAARAVARRRAASTSACPVPRDVTTATTVTDERARAQRHTTPRR